MNKRGGEGLGISTVVKFILAALVLFLLAYFIYKGFNEPAEGTIKKGREFLGNLNDISLNELREKIQKNPGGVLNSLLASCQDKKDFNACYQYISICEKGENYQGIINPLNQNEINKLKEFCTADGLKKAKSILEISIEEEAEKMYKEYLSQSNSAVKESYLEQLMGEKYAETNIAKIVKLSTLSDVPFKQQEQDIFVKVVKEKDFENLLILAGEYSKRQGYKARAIESYTIIISEKEDDVELLSKSLIGRAAISDDFRGDYTSVYLIVEDNPKLKSYFEENGYYAILLKKLKSVKIMEVNLLVGSPELANAIKHSEEIRIGETKSFLVEIDLSGKTEINEETIISFLEELSFVLFLREAGGNLGSSISCDYTFDAIGAPFISETNSIYCSDFVIRIKELHDISFPNLPVTFEIKWLANGVA